MGARLEVVSAPRRRRVPITAGAPGLLSLDDCVTCSLKYGRPHGRDLCRRPACVDIFVYAGGVFSLAEGGCPSSSTAVDSSGRLTLGSRESITFFSIFFFFLFSRDFLQYLLVMKFLTCLALQGYTRPNARHFLKTN